MRHLWYLIYYRICRFEGLYIVLQEFTADQGKNRWSFALPNSLLPWYIQPDLANIETLHKRVRQTAGATWLKILPSWVKTHTVWSDKDLLRHCTARWVVYNSCMHDPRCSCYGLLLAGRTRHHTEYILRCPLRFAEAQLQHETIFPFLWFVFLH